MPPHDRDFPRQIQRLTRQLTLITMALFLFLAIQTFELIRDRIVLANALAQQEPTVQQSLKVRQQFDSVAGGIARLADAGDANARTIIDDLQRQGFTVRNPQAGVTQ